MTKMNRRQALAVSGGLLFCWVSAAQAAQTLRWGDLIPGGGRAATPEDLLPHDENAQRNWSATNMAPAPVREDLDGTEITIRGYMTPIGYVPQSNGQRIAGFLLAPFVGACIHVPPPPSNQIILVNYPAGLEVQSRIYFDPVYVTGTVATTELDTPLARIGYMLEASDVRF